MSGEYRVLIVDDEQMVRELHKILVSNVPGMTVCGVAGSIAEARAIVATTAVDIAMLDLGLPDGGGLAFAREIRERYSDTEVVIVSADRRSESVLAARALGIADYLIKPFSGRDLKERLRRAVVALESRRQGARVLNQAEVDAMLGASRVTDVRATDPAGAMPDVEARAIRAGTALDHLRAAALATIAERAKDPECTPELVARLCAVSVRQLHRAFASKDQSVASAIRARRVRHAAVLLLDRAALPLETVATSAGFRNAQTMRRAFVEEFGLAPSDWRRQQAEAQRSSRDSLESTHA